MTTFILSLDAAKRQAKSLRAGLAAEGKDITHSQSLELVAKTAGYRDWNTLHAAIGNAPRPPVSLGQTIGGRYLNQPFLAEVTGMTELSQGRYQIVLHFAEPVDVVTFDSFSNFRSRVTKIIGPDGRSFDKTSDGQPHLVLEI